MLSLIFPKQIDNRFRGNPAAAVLLAVLLFAKGFASAAQIGLNPLLTSRQALQRFENVPLDTFHQGAAEAALVLFAWWGVASLVPTLFGALVLFRYRSLIPLALLMMAGAKIGEIACAEASPVTGMLGVGRNMPIIGAGLMLVGFAASLLPPLRFGRRRHGVRGVRS